jgi:hypothetical protein
MKTINEMMYIKTGPNLDAELAAAQRDGWVLQVITGDRVIYALARTREVSEIMVSVVTLSLPNRPKVTHARRLSKGTGRLLYWTCCGVNIKKYGRRGHVFDRGVRPSTEVTCPDCLSALAAVKLSEADVKLAEEA